MNYKLILNVLGKVMITEAMLLLCPLFVGFYYGEDNFLAFILPIILLVALGLPLALLKLKDKSLYAKEGFVIVAVAWLIFSLVGALPFVISGQIPNYVDAFFETVSGFTTTGASLVDLSANPLTHDIMFWRIFTHWIGGMGVLVFVLAILPEGSGAMHIFRAEAPGPSASKLVSRLKHTARILYLIYIVLTLSLTTLLMFGGIGLYDSLLCSFSTAGTGGFGIYANSIAHYNSHYVEMVIAVFMFIFSINFNVYYLILTGCFAKAIKSEEFLTCVIIVATSTLLIAVNILSSTQGFLDAIRLSFFQVTSISSTTGFATYDFTQWPAFSRSILLFLTLVGASGGSTGGGLKVSRLVILLKSSSTDIKRAINPRAVMPIKFEGKPVGNNVERAVRTFFLLYVLILVLSTLLLSLDGYDTNPFTHFSASLTCISNVGPGMTQLIGPFGSYAGYSVLSKLILSFTMLAGRLEIFPMLMLFIPRTWKRN